MYDRFKFRVWDNKEQDYQETDADYCHVNYKGELECRFTNDNGLYCNYVYIDDYVIEQCTGLKDKNGTLIYEGDIVLINKRRKKVYWFNGAFFCDDIREYEFNGKDPAALHYWLANGYDIEIIGNIHEENRTNKTDKY